MPSKHYTKFNLNKFLYLFFKISCDLKIQSMRATKTIQTCKIKIKNTQKFFILDLFRSLFILNI